MNPAADAQPMQDVQGDGRWMSQHKRFLTDTKREPEVLFIGDSLIQNLARTQLWKRMFEPLHCLNFGIGGDQTQHVLWRVQNGELENLEPKVIVLLVGTNNYDHTAKQVAGGIVEIVSAIQLKQPKAQIIVLGIPPRGEKPNPLRIKIKEINDNLAMQLDDIENCTFLATDPSMYVDAEGKISAMDMYDYLHLTSRGYQKLCDPLLELAQDLLQEFVKVENTSQDSDSLAGDLATKAP
ncbi:platelet-activating factor acetylhydrolase IB subunit alpha2-like [Mya arenaria]|uniref:platelet-activating factor acetylhydrolase IB subunit alpha2-like n=1 Tax=Mya arenaria TaxID=6604 RepID=UPI0022E5FC6E|nr:platelet-activating factor acetylhydrolase IB subunit alpha2-like [Mya arenaria]